MRRLERLKAEGFLLVILIVIVVINIFTTPHYLQLRPDRLFQLHIEDYRRSDHDLYHHQRRD
jgi:hypothetical protein